MHGHLQRVFIIVKWVVDVELIPGKRQQIKIFVGIVHILKSKAVIRLLKLGMRQIIVLLPRRVDGTQHKQRAAHGAPLPVAPQAYGVVQGGQHRCGDLYHAEHHKGDQKRSHNRLHQLGQNMAHRPLIFKVQVKGGLGHPVYGQHHRDTHSRKRDNPEGVAHRIHVEQNLQKASLYDLPASGTVWVVGHRLQTDKNTERLFQVINNGQNKFQYLVVQRSV